MTSLLSLLEGCSCNGHAGVGLFGQFFFDPAQPELDHDQSWFQTSRGNAQGYNVQIDKGNCIRVSDLTIDFGRIDGSVLDGPILDRTN